MKTSIGRRENLIYNGTHWRAGKMLNNILSVALVSWSQDHDYISSRQTDAISDLSNKLSTMEQEHIEVGEFLGEETMQTEKAKIN